MPNNKQPIKKVTEEIITSERFTLVNQDWARWLANQIRFLKPLIIFAGTLYIAHIQSVISVAGHVVSPSDFVPPASVVTSTFLYIFNALYDLLSKWADNKQYTISK